MVDCSVCLGNGCEWVRLKRATDPSDVFGGSESMISCSLLSVGPSMAKQLTSDSRIVSRTHESIDNLKTLEKVETFVVQDSLPSLRGNVGGIEDHTQTRQGGAEMPILETASCTE